MLNEIETIYDEVGEQSSGYVCIHHKYRQNYHCHVKFIVTVNIEHFPYHAITFPRHFRPSVCLLPIKCQTLYYAPFFQTLIRAYRESVTIFFHSFKVFNLIFFLFCDKEGIRVIFITMNDSSLSFWHPNQFFKTVIIYNKLLSCLEMDHGSSKTA